MSRYIRTCVLCSLLFTGCGASQEKSCYEATLAAAEAYAKAQAAPNNNNGWFEVWLAAQRWRGKVCPKEPMLSLPSPSPSPSPPASQK